MQRISPKKGTAKTDPFKVFPTQDPVPGANAFQIRHGGGAADAFVTKLRAGGDGLVYSTFLGGDDTDTGRSIDVDGNQNAYVTGITLSPRDFPRVNAHQAAFGGLQDGFVSKISQPLRPFPDGQPEGEQAAPLPGIIIGAAVLLLFAVGVYLVVRRRRAGSPGGVAD